jgi:hypothetical protein
MRTSRFTNEQEIRALRQAESGALASEATMKVTEHWQQLWAKKQPSKMSWFESEPTT